MGLRIPSNQIVFKYTAGKEYMDASTYQEYQGYYYEFNGSTYAGKEYNTAAPELIKMKSDNVNTLLTNPVAAIYGKISKKVIKKNNKITSIPSSVIIKGDIINSSRFYYKKVNENPILIREISEDTYISLQKDPLYQTVFVGTYQNKTQTLEDANKQMPGLKTFLSV